MRFVNSHPYLSHTGQIPNLTVAVGNHQERISVTEVGGSWPRLGVENCNGVVALRTRPLGELETDVQGLPTIGAGGGIRWRSS